jgi:Flp pilus assembly protein TadG
MWQDQRGVTAVEFALVAPVIAFIFLAAADLGLATWQRTQVAEAARAGSQYAAANGWNSDGINAAATSMSKLSISVTPTTYCGCASSGSITQQSCATACSSGGSAATYVSVATQATYTPLSPFLWGKGTTSFNATSVTRIK